MKYLFILLVFFPCRIVAQNNDAFNLDSLPIKGIVLDKGWKWQEGDNPDFARPGFDDSKWQSIDPTKDIDELFQNRKATIGWFRLHIKTDSSLANTIVSMAVNQALATEFYYNGSLVGSFGKISFNPKEVIAYNPAGYNTQDQVLHFYTGDKSPQVLAVRFALQAPTHHFKNIRTAVNHCLQITLFKTDQRGMSNENSFEKRGGFDATSLDYFKAGLSFILCLLHFCFYFFYRLQKANFWFGLFCLIMFAHFLSEPIIFQYFRGTSYTMFAERAFWFELLTAFLFLQTAVYALFSYRKRFIFGTLTVFVAGYFICSIINIPLDIVLFGGIGFLISLLINLDIARVSIKAFKNKKDGALILVLGALGYILFTIAYITVVVKAPETRVLEHLFANINYLSIPVSITLFLAREFAQTTRSLAIKLFENEKLTAHSIAQEKEKQLILTNQNETLENQVAERTVALNNSLTELKSTQALLIQSAKMASLGELTAGIAHEIQNPLNFVNNFSEVNKELIAEMREEISKGNYEEVNAIANDVGDNEEKINHHGKRAGDIVKGMLEHSRSSTGVKEPTDINALADEYLRLSYHGLRAKDKSFNAEMKPDFDNSIGKINIIPQDIGRVLLNLYNNAFYACTERSRSTVNQQISENLISYEPTVSVTTKKSGNNVIITVSDNGNGIPQKIVDKIFQPFFTTKPTGQGTGLGLSISYDIVKAHGGELKVETRENQGTEFIIQIPA